MNTLSPQGTSSSLTNPRPAAIPKTNRPKAVFMMGAEAYDLVLGHDQRAALDQLTCIVGPRLDKDNWRNFRSELAEAEIAITGWEAPKLDHEILAAMPKLKIVFHAAGSVKFMLSDEFWARGLRVTCAAAVNAIPVVEFSFAEIILSLKRVWQSSLATHRQRRFVRDDALVPSCFGSTVGLISLGLIGRAVARRLASLDVKVIAYDPVISPAEAQALGVRLCSLDELFAEAHVVSCHAPLLDATTHLVRGAHLHRLRTGATFINTSRGRVVHGDELIDVLRQRPDLFAVLDVTDPEPPPADSPLFDLPNVMLTPHISGSIGPECRRMGAMICEELARHLAGQPLVAEVRREALALIA